MKNLLPLCLCVTLLLSLNTGVAQGQATNLAIQYVEDNAAALGLTTDDVSDMAVSDAYTSQHNGVTHVYLQQQYQRVGVYNALINANVTQDNRVLVSGNTYVPNLADKVSGVAGLSPTAAVEVVAAHLGLTITESLTVLSSTPGPSQETVVSRGGIARDDIPARLVYQRLASGEVRLAWNVGIDVAGGIDWWQVRVDAATGQVLDQNNWVVQDDWGVAEHPSVMDPAPGSVTFPFAENPDSYRVYPVPAESPLHPSPGGTTHSIETDPADATFSPFAWHDTDGVAGAEFTITRGNNVHAYEDRDGDDVPPSPSNEPDGGPTLDFDFPVDLTMNPRGYLDAATVNLFYWNNVIHDILAILGFDEPGGNFQETNYTALGLGGDYVRAQAQARADLLPSGSTRCNANFSTPADGSRPRMRMYVCDNTIPFRDGDFDNGVILHEYGHGISNRLTGGPANVGCLNNDEQAGEGWSDFYGLMLTQQVGDAGADARGIGTYLFGQPPTGPGIRARPYSTAFGVNEFTYDTIIGTGGSPHALGHVWATIVWDMTWALIGDPTAFPGIPTGDNGAGGGSGFNPNFYLDGTNPAAGGNNLALQFVTDGMKLQGCSPGFVDARNGILLADEMMTAGADLDPLTPDGRNACAMWTAFARRGLGLSADQGSAFSRTDGTEAFDVPAGACGPPPPMTRYVDPTGNDTANDCTNPAFPCATIAHAVSEADAGDTLDIAAGTYNEPGLVIEKELNIVGAGVIVQ